MLRTHRRAAATPLASTKQKSPILKLPVSRPERAPSLRPRIRAVLIPILQMSTRQRERAAIQLSGQDQD